MKVKSILYLLIILSFFLLWECLMRRMPHMSMLLPPPSSIAQSMIESKHILLVHARATLIEMIEGFLIALAVAFPLAWTMLLWKTWGGILQTFFVVIQCVPMFALAPLMVLWFGWSQIAIVLSTALMIFFPLAINIYRGFSSTPLAYLNYFKANRATSWQIFSKLQLPFAMPHIFSGLRIGLATSGVGAVAGEWAGASKGLGVLMLESRQGVDLELTFAALFCLVGLSLGFYGISLLLERRSLILRTLFKDRVVAIGRQSCLLFLVLSFGYGCSSIEKEVHPNSPSLTRIALDWTPCPNHVPLFVGIEKGFFADEGIDLKISQIKDCVEPIPLLCSDGVDLILSHQPRSIKAYAKGAQIQMVGRLIDQPLCSFMMMKDSSIQSIQDLNGKILGYSGSSFGRAFHDILLENAHVQIKEKVNVSFDLVGALISKNVDFIYGAYWNIEGDQLASLGFNVSYFPLSEFGVPNYEELIVLARAGSIHTQLDFIIKFRRALQKSIDYSREHPKDAFELYAQANPNKSAKVLAWEKRSWERTIPLFAKEQDPQLDQIQDFIDWLIAMGLLEKYFDAKDFALAVETFVSTVN